MVGDHAGYVAAGYEFVSGGCEDTLEVPPPGNAGGDQLYVREAHLCLLGVRIPTDFSEVLEGESGGHTEC